MPGDASRENGKKGGRPLGSENADTVTRRRMQKRWLKKVSKHGDKIFEAHLDLALGHHKVETLPDGTIIRVYKTSPDGKSLAWMQEQVWGKAEQPINLGGSLNLSSELSPEEGALLTQALDYVAATALEARNQHPQQPSIPEGAGTP